MGQILSLRFIYEDSEYYTLLRVIENDGRKEYHITIMNNELEAQLYGNHIMTGTDGKLEVGLPENKELSKLKLQIADAVSKYLNLKIVPIRPLQNK